MKAVSVIQRRCVIKVNLEALSREDCFVNMTRIYERVNAFLNFSRNLQLSPIFNFLLISVKTEIYILTVFSDYILFVLQFLTDENIAPVKNCYTEKNAIKNRIAELLRKILQLCMGWKRLKKPYTLWKIVIILLKFHTSFLKDGFQGLKQEFFLLSAKDMSLRKWSVHKANMRKSWVIFGSPGAIVWGVEPPAETFEVLDGSILA